MSAIGTITLADGQSTPVNHVFDPLKIDGDTARYRNSDAASASGFMPLAISLRDPIPGGASQVYRVQVSLAVPIVQTQTVNGITSDVVVRTGRFNGEFIIDASATQAERKDLRAFAKNLLADTVMASVLEGLQHIY